MLHKEPKLIIMITGRTSRFLENLPHRTEFNDNTY